MTLKDQLMADMKQALKAGEKTRLSSIRLAISQVKNVEIDSGELDDAGVQQVLAKMVKQLKDALTEFQRAGRRDIVSAEQEKIKVLEEYLPDQLSDQELDRVVDEVIANSNQPRMGQVIGQVMAQAAGRADGAKVARLVKAKLG
ncbi:MAG: glutamyl-tRNA amidotransferase [Candidatus Pacebacteria bacterium CG10_big_fil_rev_8_21_14_0_10_56_10]|nr:MAG: glutamyl-tRNA amidotransferase [Candidatus Pacebacteria bacterium CG10_big_fil_rev_8_21_14_0_10_56_10]